MRDVLRCIDVLCPEWHKSGHAHSSRFSAARLPVFPFSGSAVFFCTVDAKAKIGYTAGMTDLTAGITSRVKGRDIYYTLTWSPLTKADKYEITLRVPAVAGVFELYRMDEEKRLNLLAVTHAWYGGLRSQLREAVDPDATNNPVKKAAVSGADLYYRYAPSDKLETLLDVVWFLHNAYFPGDVRVENSGRYDNIYLNERAPDRLYWMD